MLLGIMTILVIDETCYLFTHCGSSERQSVTKYQLAGKAYSLLKNYVYVLSIKTMLETMNIVVACTRKILLMRS